ncbi:hypothetical protein CapIbe_024119 [Capra ibex]
MAWSPLLLTLGALCTGSWAQAVLTQPPCFPNFGSEGHHLLHWKQQQNWGLSCELVPTAPRIGPQTPDL